VVVRVKDLDLFLCELGLLISREVYDEEQSCDQETCLEYGQLAVSNILNLYSNMNLAIHNLHKHKLFPYNPKALLRLLSKSIQHLSRIEDL
jgi:hypothetical protein